MRPMDAPQTTKTLLLLVLVNPRFSYSVMQPRKYETDRVRGIERTCNSEEVRLEDSKF
jgi:hypothetical protein